ncbi:NAD(+) synthase [soil metagenome]
MSGVPFLSPYAHGFVRAAVCVPDLRVADPAFNAGRTIAMAERAHAGHAAVALFPELGISAYSCDDLFHQDALLEGVRDALGEVVAASRTLRPLLLVGAPLRFGGRLFNCAVAIHAGRVLGVTPKSYLPNYREYYEKRQFSAARDATAREVELCGGTVPFGDGLIYEAAGIEGFAVGVEVCEDLWAPLPPSTFAALGGATVLANLSASNITVGKAEYRRSLCAAHSGKCIAAYLYSAAGPGESTTDLAWDGDALIFENGDLLAGAERFSDHEEMVVADIDLDRLIQDRMRQTSFGDTVSDYRERAAQVRRVPFAFEAPADEIGLVRDVPRFPYVPRESAERDQRCFEAYNIQIHGLLKRLRSSGIHKVVIGVSGGLDSTQALLVAAKAMDAAGLPRENVLGFTMPGFATSGETLANAWALMRGLGVSGAEIDIRPSCRQMLADLGHPFAEGKEVYDVTFENVQAGERTSHLFRLANHHGGLVVGTGDLSELALGWCTYGVGDHMSHYNVNASVPKTLIQHLIRWEIERAHLPPEACAALRKIADTEISPELVPADATDGALQSSEDKIGPYHLQDFNIYFTTRFGYRPSKVAYLAHHAWGEEFDLATIKKWLRVFLWRFFKTSQFKRSCVPNSPKVGSGGSLSPRGDWRAPSDSEAAVWIDELDANVPDR